MVPGFSVRRMVEGCVGDCIEGVRHVVGGDGDAEEEGRVKG